MFSDEPDEPTLEDDEEQVVEGDGLGSSLTSEEWLAGVIAKHYEEAGLIPTTDDFSWEWHCLFDVSFAEAMGAAPGAAAPLAPSAASESTAQDGVDSSPDFGFGSDFGGGDFGGF